MAAASDLQRLFESLQHLDAGADFRELFDAAAGKTGADLEGFNQRIKCLRFVGLYEALKAVLAKGLAGDVAECGCYRGQSSWIMATLLQRHRFAGRFFIFDSFRGLSSFGEEDLEGMRATAEELARRRERFSSSELSLRSVLSEFPFVSVMPGWIPARFDEVGDRAFAFVHVDVDLYQPTRDSLEFFFPRLAAGGALVVDDYNWARFPGARTAVDEFVRKQRPALFLPFQVGGCLLMK